MLAGKKVRAVGNDYLAYQYGSQSYYSYSRGGEHSNGHTQWVYLPQRGYSLQNRGVYFYRDTWSTYRWHVEVTRWHNSIMRLHKVWEVLPLIRHLITREFTIWIGSQTLQAGTVCSAGGEPTNCCLLYLYLHAYQPLYWKIACKVKTLTHVPQMDHACLS